MQAASPLGAHSLPAGEPAGATGARRAVRAHAGRFSTVAYGFLRRALQIGLVLVGVSLATFLMLNVLPGDPAVAALGEQATPEALQNLRAELGLDRSLATRYLDWAGGALQGDLGDSYRTGEPVLEAIRERLPVSIEIMVLAELIALAFAVPGALLCAWKRDQPLDRLLSFSAFSALSLPNFLLAILLILVFAVHFQVLPATGFSPLSNGIAENLRTAILPAVTLAATHYAIYLRLLRSEMLDTLSEDYISTAQAKGLGYGRVLVRHVMRNSLFALITVLGVNAGTLIGGAVITETIFALPGLGALLIDSIGNRDFIMVQGIVLFIAVGYVAINFVVDSVYYLLDPRIRYGR